MYVELHARSAFSFLEGASTPEELASACSALGMSSMALLDRDGLYGAPRFYLAAQKIGIRAHIGAEITCLQGWRYPLLVTSPAGYKNLCRLITRMKLRAAKGEGAIAASELENSSPPMRSALAEGKALGNVWSNCALFSAAKMSTSNCNATSPSKRNAATRSLLNSRAAYIFLCFPPTVYAMLCLRNAKFWMSLPACGITACSPMRGDCFPATANAI